MQKILLVIQSLEGGGAERVFANLANSFFEKGVTVEILLGKKEGVFLSKIHPKIPTHELRTHSFLGYILKLPGFFKNRSYTHVLSTGDYVSASLVFLKKIKLINIQIIPVLEYDPSFYFSQLPLINRKWLFFLYKNFICKTAPVVTACKGIAENLIKLKMINANNVTVIYNPVIDEEMLKKGGENFFDPLFDKGKKTLISVGRLTAQKDHATLIDAFYLLRQRRADIQLVILGIGDKEQELRDQISRLALTKEVLLIGFKENPYAYVAKSDLFVLASVFEGFGNVIAEALGMGINIVCTDCPSGPSEILDKGKYGWLSPVGNPKLLADSIETAIENPKPPAMLKAYAERFHVNTIAKQYLQLLS